MKELEKTVRAILLNDWDPIGVKSNPNAKAEYDQYALKVVGMLSRGASVQEIEAYLNGVTEREFELPPNTAVTQGAVKKLVGVNTR